MSIWRERSTQPRARSGSDRRLVLLLHFITYTRLERLSLTYKFVRLQTGVSDTFPPDLKSET